MMANQEKRVLEVVGAAQSNDGAAKYTYRLLDGQIIESVILKHENMICACISSQVGCPFDCIFCVTGQLGFIRDLSVAEIIGQLTDLENRLTELHAPQTTFNRVLFMGMGEPLLNYEKVVQSALLIHRRHIADTLLSEVFLATSGILPKKIYELAQDAPFIRLWISLCAADDKLRAELAPAVSFTSIEALLHAGETYAGMTGHPVYVNYLMIDGLTDSFPYAEKLVDLLRGRHFRLQLSRLNPIPKLDLQGSPIKTVYQFAEFTNSRGIPTTVFMSKGTRIMAACGQLSGTLREGSTEGARYV